MNEQLIERGVDDDVNAVIKHLLHLAMFGAGTRAASGVPERRRSQGLVARRPAG